MKRLLALSLVLLLSLSACNLPAAVDGFFEGLNAPTETAIQTPVVQQPKPANTPTGNGNSTFSTKWVSADTRFSGVVTIKTNPSGCKLPDVVCYMVDEAGVLGADNLAEANANKSAVWTGGADHQTAQTASVGVIIPEGSYVTAYAKQFTIKGGGYNLVFNDCGPHCAWGFLGRGWFAETHVDRNIPITISNYGAVGAMKYTRYPVPVEAGQFFSQDYLTAQAKNALKFDNCGIGSEDCDVFMQAIFDYNDGSLTILRYTQANGWELVWTNISGHGR